MVLQEHSRNSFCAREGQLLELGGRQLLRIGRGLVIAVEGIAYKLAARQRRLRRGLKVRQGARCSSGECVTELGLWYGGE